MLCSLHNNISFVINVAACEEICQPGDATMTTGNVEICNHPDVSAKTHVAYMLCVCYMDKGSDTDRLTELV